MSRQRIVQALKPRTGFVPPLLGTCYLGHEGSGTSVSDFWGNGSNLAIVGTTTGLWAVPGEISLSGDNYIPLFDATNDILYEIMRLDNIGADTIICGFDVYMDVAPSANAALFSSGIMNTAYTIGGYELMLNTATQIIFRYFEPGSGAITNLPAFGSVSSLLPAKLSMMLEIDGGSDDQNILLNLFVDGSLLGSNTIPKSTSIGSVTVDGARRYGHCFAASQVAAGSVARILPSGYRISRLINWRGRKEPGFGAKVANELAQVPAEAPILLYEGV